MPAAASPDDLVVLRDPVALPSRLAHPVVVIGNFDGIHRGHAAVIAEGLALARRLGRPCAVLTFEPHPADFFAGGPVMFRLTPAAARATLLARLGIDGLIVLPFDQNLAGLSADEFVTRILVGRLGISAAVVGFDFHFARKREGTPDFLKQAGARYGFTVEIVARVTADCGASAEAVHSTAAREALEKGDVARARRLLGHDWFVVGEVVHGQKIGRTLGFPTANIALDPSCRLRYGIYAVRLRVDGHIHDAVASFGRRPTFDNGPPLLEVHVLDFADDLYGKQVEVDFVDWIRGEEKFSGAEALVERIHRDVAEARAMLAVRPAAV